MTPAYNGKDVIVAGKLHWPTDRRGNKKSQARRLAVHRPETAL